MNTTAGDWRRVAGGYVRTVTGRFQRISRRRLVWKVFDENDHVGTFTTVREAKAAADAWKPRMAATRER